MATQEVLPAPEKSGEVPPLTLNLKDVPEDSPKAFTDALVANTQSAIKGFVDYLNANRETAIGKHFFFAFLKYMPDPKRAEAKLRADLDAQVDEFIFDLQNSSKPLLAVLKANQNQPIQEQRVAALYPFYTFSLKMAGYQGVMQSFIPFKLEAGYDAIYRGIEVPLVGFDFRSRHATYRPARRSVDMDPEHDNADRILDELGT